MAFKVGDKVDVKWDKFNQKEEKTEKFNNTLEDIAKLLKKKSNTDSFNLQWLEQAYSILEGMFEEDSYKSCKICKNTYIPLIEYLMNNIDLSNLDKFYTLYKKFYAFAGRRDLECFIDYMEFEKPHRVLANRRKMLIPCVDAMNKIALDDNTKYVIISLPPSSGKSFLLNYYTAWTYGLDINNSNLRLSYSEDLVLGFSRSIKEIITNPLFADVFPRFKYFDGKPFEKEKESDWKIKGANVLTSHISRTRDGSVTGVRANKTILFDDMTKGAEEATNADLHRKLYDKWKTEWFNRKDGRNTKFVFAGTMWSPEDILNRVREDREMNSPLIESTKYKYTWVSEDKETIVIRIPMLDENDETTCPEVYSTEEALDIRNTTDPYLFSCVYQQEPIAPTGLEFAWELLNTFEKLPLQEDGTDAFEPYAYASLDPARKGKDNVSMPIHIKGFDGKYYLVDCIFKQKPMSDLYDEIVSKIIEWNIITLVIENNTDTSLRQLIEEKLQQQNYNLCIIKEKYNVKIKEQRIKDMRGHLKRFVMFKDKSKVLPNTDYGRFMKNFTTYSFDYPSKHDDAPDSEALFTSEIILGGAIMPKVTPLSRSEYGL